MIRDKMEMSRIIKSLNELDKLKLLLFDKNQLEIFEQIPKPYLIDAVKAYENCDDEEDGELTASNDPN
jgi:hypothetical protein